MEQVIKQSFGIDISKNDFSVCLAKCTVSGQLYFSDSIVFSNEKKGFNQFLKWGKKHLEGNIPVFYLMEATGIYFEALAYHLYKINKNVVVLLPNKVKHFAKSLNVKTKTDAVDAKIISQLGVERSHQLWHPPLRIFSDLRSLTRLCTDLKRERTIFANRLSTFTLSESSHDFVLQSTKKMIAHIDKQIKKCELKIHQLVKNDNYLNSKFKKLQTIKGLGFTSIAIIISETQGFALINNRKQLASYAGYDVIQRESGISIKGKTRISKRGNSRIRAALHFPAMVASRFNPVLKEDYQRIIKNKSSKMIGIVALQRKLLLLTFTLWKNDDIYRDIQ